eukprot:CAMPEP_0182428590 /NCGR_PEP_ID=MMETSP1167-20130531/23132_1 /TAXON_ID=2988 /ORGANISM="Mallomonas Sp, Strain CCMP3275" /LENGTH=243 /DNA_ID=CAMNT_0024611565 /DNA_START=414 /DNA_END=1145 /DNA_ORIENTATION=+
MTITIAASVTHDDNIPIRFPDDISIASDGRVYFSDASLVSPELDDKGNFDVMYASKLDIAMGSGSGRLLRYDPITKHTETLISGLLFANGVALSSNQSFVCVVETVGFRVRRYWLTGDKQNSTDMFLSALPGFPDGISLAADGGFWLAIFAPVTPVVSLVLNYRWLGYLLSVMNPHLLPVAKPYGAVYKVDPQGRPIGSLQDPKGLVVDKITSVTENKGKLYIGSTHLPFIGMFDLEQCQLSL